MCVLSGTGKCELTSTPSPGNRRPTQTRPITASQEDASHHLHCSASHVHSPPLVSSTWCPHIAPTLGPAGWPSQPYVGHVPLFQVPTLLGLTRLAPCIVKSPVPCAPVHGCPPCNSHTCPSAVSSPTMCCEELPCSQEILTFLCPPPSGRSQLYPLLSPQATKTPSISGDDS